MRRERLIARGELPKEALDAPLSDEEEDQKEESSEQVNIATGKHVVMEAKIVEMNRLIIVKSGTGGQRDGYLGGGYQARGQGTS